MRRSRCEIKLLKMLRKSFPTLRMVPNDRKLLDGYEIDISIPSLHLAIEWNGIVHRKPIYGEATLARVQVNDAAKAKLAAERGIELVVIEDLKSTPAFVRVAANRLRQIIRSRL